MDSSAYRFYIEKSLPQIYSDLSVLPAGLVVSGGCCPEIAPVRLFMRYILHTEKRQGSCISLLDASKSRFSALMLDLHAAIDEALSPGFAAASHPFRDNALEIVTLLSYSINRQGCRMIPSICRDLAMACFLIEACLHLGWNSSAFEGFAKRAAHLYFGFMKKVDALAFDHERVTVIGYLSCALIMAQTTEGIAQQRLPAETAPIDCTINLKSGSEAFACWLYHTPRPQLCTLFPVSKKLIPHPLMHLATDGIAGLHLSSAEGQIRPVELMDSAAITRPGMRGRRVTYRCIAPGDQFLRWTVAVLIRQSTIYRIDTLSANTPIVDVSAILILETDAWLEGSGQRYRGAGPQDIVIEFIDYPCEIIFVGSEPGISTFKLGSRLRISSQPLRLVVAWAQGKGVSAISRTELLGLYD